MMEVAGAGAARLALALVTVLLVFTQLAGPASAWGSRRYHVTVHEPGSGPVRLFVEEAGEGSPVVLLHGVGGSTYAWRKVAPALARSHRVIAIDLKGFGRSDKPEGPRYAPRDQARLVAGVLAALDLNSVTLVGHSFGGTVALALVIRRDAAAARVERLVLIDSPALPQRWPAVSELTSVPGAAELTLAVTPPELIVRTAFSHALKRQSAVSEADIEAYARPLYTPGARGALSETIRHLIATDFARAARAYAGIRQPALILWCRSDPLVPLRTGVLLARKLPQATLVIDENCGHIPLEETPGQVAARIRDFIR